MAYQLMNVATLYLRMTKMSDNNCLMPKVRKNVWVVYDTQGNRIGEVGAMTENEARQKVADHVRIPFRLSHVEE